MLAEATVAPLVGGMNSATVQTTYFWDRLTRDDRTGIEDGSGNEKGLADARRGREETAPL